MVAVVVVASILSLICFPLPGLLRLGLSLLSLVVEVLLAVVVVVV